MPRVAILTLPSANRVYGREVSRLALAELRTVAGAMHAELELSDVAVMGGVEYLVLEMPELDEHDQFILSNLSATYACFAVTERDSDADAQGELALTPLEVRRLECFSSDLITIQRYAGKTNEQFTHLLVNVAVAASAAARERSAEGLPVRLIDPLSGRGTTLNRGLMYGFDVTGIDLDATDYEAYKGFLTTYCKDNRLSHRSEGARVRKGALAGARSFTVRIGERQRVVMVKDDTVNAAAHFGARSFDVLVTDLPYGVQHGSTTTGGVTRSPEELVRAALPVWRGLLRSGAGLAVSWNLKTFGRDSFETALREAGFTVHEGAAAFDHKVDRSIVRAVVIATT
jgi:hypothetical protein